VEFYFVNNEGISWLKEYIKFIFELHVQNFQIKKENYDLCCLLEHSHIRIYNCMSILLVFFNSLHLICTSFHIIIISKGLLQETLHIA